MASGERPGFDQTLNTALSRQRGDPRYYSSFIVLFWEYLGYPVMLRDEQEDNSDNRRQ
jgi:hypothetical protein